MQFVPAVLESINRHFFPSDERHVIVYTNLELPSFDYPSLHIHRQSIPHEQWPFVTLKRFHYFLEAEQLLASSDYCFYMDVDALFIRTFDQPLPSHGVFGTIHPIHHTGPGTPERNAKSTAYIREGSQSRYYYGGFFGGTSKDFLAMAHELKDCVDKDLHQGYIAVWHDESQMNRYMFTNSPSLTFEFPFATAEGVSQIVPESCIYFLEKANRGGHNYFRGIT